jgi:hypothetical protein
MVPWVPTLITTQLYHGSEGKERQHPVSSINLSCFLDMFLYLSFFSRREGGGETVGDRAGDVGCAGAIVSFIAPCCNNRGGEATRLYRSYKKAQ